MTGGVVINRMICGKLMRCGAGCERFALFAFHFSSRRSFITVILQPIAMRCNLFRITRRQVSEQVVFPLELWLHLWGDAKGVLGVNEHCSSDASSK
jgi:hypothetical protein